MHARAHGYRPPADLLRPPLPDPRAVLARFMQQRGAS
jgi:hypothetical protein